MPAFRANIKVDNQKYLLEFTKVQTDESQKYFVKATSNTGTATHFEVKQSETRWKIVLPAPRWAVEIENQIGRIINQQGDGDR